MPDQKVIRSLPTILERLHSAYPGARYELNWETPLQLLVATILAAQCTDERVNQVTATLFKKYPSAEAFADASLPELEEDLKPTGFYREKARKVQETCRALILHFGGEVPKTMEEMVTLPGVARKTANVVLNNAFGLPTGVIVDTHVQRVSQRMGLTDQKKPEKIELDLMQNVPKEEWVFFGPAMVLLGRYVCTFHNPACAFCMMSDLCPKIGVGEESNGDSAEESADSEEDTPTMAKKTTTSKKTRGAATKTATATKTAPVKAKTAEPAVASLREQLPADWQAVLKDEFDKPYFKALEKFVAEERAQGAVYPPAEDVFNAFKATPFDRVKVVLLGQDPYHGAGEAHGMCFSVKPGVKVPPSLVNIYKELQDDVGCKPPPHGYLASWAAQGVFLLNTVLTVKANQAASHKNQGWEQFTDAVIKAVSARKQPAVFLLWGNQAQAKEAIIDTKRHRVLKGNHPSPLSAKKGFFGSKPFSTANKALQEFGVAGVNWQVPDDPMASATATPQPSTVIVSAARIPAPTPAPAVVKEEPTRLETLIPADWRKALAGEFSKPYFRQLDKYLAAERNTAVVCPDEADLFAALRATPLSEVRLVLLGQEPPCASDVADGLAFSAREGVDPSETQQTIFKELRRDLGYRVPVSGSLAPWARQGVLLLNLVLSVREGKPGSHRNQGWDQFTDAIIKAVSTNPTPTVFALWGGAAIKKRSLIDETRHRVLTAEHPSTSPERFIDSGIFSEINIALDEAGRSSIYWQLPYV
jgi:uracil-DNA glycosylase/endonuclease III